MRTPGVNFPPCRCVFGYAKSSELKLIGAGEGDYETLCSPEHLCNDDELYYALLNSPDLIKAGRHHTALSIAARNRARVCVGGERELSLACCPELQPQPQAQHRGWNSDPSLGYAVRFF